MAIKAVMIDSREPKHIQSLCFDGAIKAVTMLDYGDALITTDDGEMICVERKTPTDLLGSIADERLFAQMRGIKALTEWAYLVITGELTANVAGLVVADKRTTGWRYDSVWGALLTAQEMGVRVVMCAHEGDYEAAVMRLCNRRRGAEYIIKPTVDAREMTQAERFLTSLPGIGLERAQALLGEFNGRACDALAWLTWHRWSADYHIPGIGDATKKAVRKAIGMDDSMVFDVVPDEMLQKVSIQKAKVAA